MVLRKGRTYGKRKLKRISRTAVGGGSPIDTAKCLKLYSNMDDKQNYLEQKIIQNETELIAIPTTAGTGSEATRFAVIQMCHRGKRYLGRPATTALENRKNFMEYLRVL